MRVVLIILLAIVLPLQMAWARVSDTCLDHAAGHVHVQADGHDHKHEHHGHSADAPEPAAGDEPPSTTDCHHACHHFTAVVSAPVLPTQGPLPDLVTVPPPPWAADQAAPRPDRPQWPALA
jgi:hypothetical protein